MLQGMPSLGGKAIVISGDDIWLCHGARACHSSFELFAVALLHAHARDEIPPLKFVTAEI